jgi:hypothetical protein
MNLFKNLCRRAFHFTGTSKSLKEGSQISEWLSTPARLILERLYMLTHVSTNPQYHRESKFDYTSAGVRELGILRADSEHLPPRAIRKVAGDGRREFWEVDFDIEMTLHSANITFALVFKGQSYQALQFDFS